MAYTTVPSKATGDPAYTATFLNTYIKDNFAAGVPDIFTTKGDIAAATAADTATRVAVGSNNTVFQIQSGQSAGVQFRAQPAADKITAKGQILAATAANTFSAIAAGGKASTLMISSGEGAGVIMSDSGGLAGLIQAKGDLIAGSAADTAGRVAAGTVNGSVLVSDSNEAAGVRWRNNGASKMRNQTTQNVENETYTTIDFNTEVYDVASASSVGSDSYTVPVTGYYMVVFNTIYAPALAANLINKRLACAVVDGSNNVLSIVGAQHRMTTSTTAPFGIVHGLDILYLTAGTIIYPKYWHNYGTTYSFNVANSGQEFSVTRIGA